MQWYYCWYLTLILILLLANWCVLNVTAAAFAVAVGLNLVFWLTLPYWSTVIITFASCLLLCLLVYIYTYDCFLFCLLSHRSRFSCYFAVLTTLQANCRFSRFIYEMIAASTFALTPQSMVQIPHRLYTPSPHTTHISIHASTSNYSICACIFINDDDDVVKSRLLFVMILVLCDAMRYDGRACVLVSAIYNLTCKRTEPNCPRVSCYYSDCVWDVIYFVMFAICQNVYHSLPFLCA